MIIIEIFIEIFEFYKPIYNYLLDNSNKTILSYQKQLMLNKLEYRITYYNCLISNIKTLINIYL